MVEGKVRSIGYYDNEEDAAADYARAAYKYKEKKVHSNVYGGLDLSGVPESLPLIRQEGTATGFVNVKPMKGRFQARIFHEQKNLTLGTFDTPEEAALIYARAKWYLESKPQEEKRENEQVANEDSHDEDPVDRSYLSDIADPEVDGVAV